MGSLRHINRSKKLRRARKATAIPGHLDYGNGQDHNRYYRCIICGFVCDVKRDALGGPNDTHGISITPYSLEDQYGDAAASGDIIKSTTRYFSEVDMGCPVCGSLNWRGDY